MVVNGATGQMDYLRFSAGNAQKELDENKTNGSYNAQELVQNQKITDKLVKSYEKEIENIKKQIEDFRNNKAETSGLSKERQKEVIENLEEKIAELEQKIAKVRVDEAQQQLMEEEEKLKENVAENKVEQQPLDEVEAQKLEADAMTDLAVKSDKAFSDIQNLKSLKARMEVESLYARDSIEHQIKNGGAVADDVRRYAKLESKIDSIDKTVMSDTKDLNNYTNSISEKINKIKMNDSQSVSSDENSDEDAETVKISGQNVDTYL